MSETSHIAPQDEVASMVSTGVELLYRPGESIFGEMASALVENGWSVFPQHRDGKRLPGSIDGEPIKWRTDHNLSEALPTDDALALWKRHLPGLNVACVFGPASGHTFAVDIDITDYTRAAAVEEMAVSHLGATPLRRQGRAPKIALIYRHAPDDNIASISRQFPDGDGLEILSTGKLLTFYGLHHVTREYFRWDLMHPYFVGPDIAPLVSRAQVDAFIEAVNVRFPFIRPQGAAGDWSPTRGATGSLGPGNWTEEGGRVVDGRERFITYLAMTAVSDGRDVLLSANEKGEASWEVTLREIADGVANTFFALALCEGKWAQRHLFRESFSRVSRFATGLREGRFQPSYRRTASRPDKGAGAGDQRPLNRVTATPRRTRRVDDDMSQGDVVDEVACPAPVDPEMSFLRHPRSTQQNITVYQGPEDAPSLAIPVNREQLKRNINNRLNDAIAQFFDAVYAGLEGQAGDETRLRGAGGRSRVDIMIAPTGAGKTSQTIRYIAADPRTYRDMPVLEDGQITLARMPIVMLLPTYANISELRQRAVLLGLDGSAPDEVLRAQALQTGLIEESELEVRLADIRRDAIQSGRAAGLPQLSTLVYSGKIRAGCQMADIVSLAMQAGIGTSNFCMTTRKDKETGEKVTDYCQFYEGCPAQAQRAAIREAHVIFMPHSFLALDIPEELKQVRCVIADERIHHLFLHSTTVSSNTLTMERRQPRLTLKDREEGLEVEDFVAGRNEACEVFLQAIRADMRCPSEAFYALDRENRELGGTRLIEMAIKVCKSALTRDSRLTPNMTLPEVQDICLQPLGVELREELQLWEILQDRLARTHWQREVYDSAMRNLLRQREGLAPRGTHAYHDQSHRNIDEQEAAFNGLRSRNGIFGDTDARIQLVFDDVPAAGEEGVAEERIRLSWRTRPNWTEVPTLLLDASAHPDVISKIWGLPADRVTIHNIADDVGKSLNVKIVAVVDRTYSQSWMTGSEQASQSETIIAAQRLARVRRAISTISSLYGDGRVVVGTSIKLRRLINEAWLAPQNSDWCHYGAMRGLDMFKSHSAAVSIGRMEVPTRVIDGLVAALTYDDETPERPHDYLGTGFTDESRDTRLMLASGQQTVRLRDGRVATLDVPVYEGRWARIMQKQYREEEISQFVGRLRPVYREGRTPVWFALSSVIPEGLIVDEVISLSDLLHEDGRDNLWEGIRRLGGVLAEVLLHNECRDMFPTSQMARRIMMECGFDEKGAAITHRAGRGFSILRWRPSGAHEWQTAFAQASLGERAEAVLRAKIASCLVVAPESLSIETVLRAPAHKALVRPADTVDGLIGTPEERQQSVERRMAEMGMYLMDKPRIQTLTPDRVQQWQIGLESEGVDTQEMSAYWSIRAWWTNPVQVRPEVLAGVIYDECTDLVF